MVIHFHHLKGLLQGINIKGFQVSCLGYVVYRVATGLVLCLALIFTKLKYFSLFASNPLLEVSCFSKVISPLFYFWYYTCINLATIKKKSQKLTNFQRHVSIRFEFKKRRFIFYFVPNHINIAWCIVLYLKNTSSFS